MTMPNPPDREIRKWAEFRAIEISQRNREGIGFLSRDILDALLEAYAQGREDEKNGR